MWEHYVTLKKINYPVGMVKRLSTKELVLKATKSHAFQHTISGKV
jgi:hypothetical protein